MDYSSQISSFLLSSTSSAASDIALPPCSSPSPGPSRERPKSGPKSDIELLCIFGAVVAARERHKLHDIGMSVITQQFYELMVVVLGEIFPHVKAPFLIALRFMLKRFKTDGILRKKRTGGKVSADHKGSSHCIAKLRGHS